MQKHDTPTDSIHQVRSRPRLICPNPVRSRKYGFAQRSRSVCDLRQHLELQLGDGNAHRSSSMTELYSASTMLSATPNDRSLDATVGHVVPPGKALSREQRRRRQIAKELEIDNAIFAISHDDMSFAHLWQQIKRETAARLRNLDNKLGLTCQEAVSCLDHYKHAMLDPSPHSGRSLLLTLILFILVFGSLHLLTSCLLTTTRATAQCAPITSYVPVTYTVTSYVTPSSIATANKQEGPVSVEMTSTSTHTLTVMLSEVTPAVTASQIAGGSYYYAVQSGQTSWLDDVSPPNGVPLTTTTTTIYVDSSSTPVTSTLEAITVLPPPYSSTTYSVQSPDSTSTTTSTRTTTTTLSDAVTLTRTRSAFTPPGSYGWNYTTSASADAGGLSESSSLVQGVPTTITGAVYWSTGTRITSTSLTTLTLTLTRSHESTITITSSQTASLPTAETPPTDSVSPTSLQPESTLYSIISTATSASGPSALSSSHLSLETTPAIVPASYSALPESKAVSTLVSTPIVTLSIEQPTSGQSPPSATSIVPVETTATVIPSQSGLSFVPYSPISPVSSSAESSISAVSASTAGSSLQSIVGPSSSGTALSVASTSIVATYSSPTVVAYSSTPGSSGIAISPATASGSSIGSMSSANSSYAASAALTTSLVTSSLASPTSTYPLSSVGANTSDVMASSTQVSNTISSHSILGPSSVTTASTSIASSAASSSSISSANATSAGPTSLSASPEISSYPSTASTAATSASITSASVSPTPSVCGEHGNFTLNFDDLPDFSTNNTTDITQAPPIFNGYHHLAFSNGYVYAPPPSDPYPPVSPPHLAVFLGNASGNGLNNTPSAMAPTSAGIRHGEFGDGSSASQSAFWFDAYSTWLGCDNSGPEPCTYIITAYAWNSAAQQEEQIGQETTTTPACPDFQNCQLQQHSFPSSFVGLSGLQIQAYKGPNEVMFFMDDVAMGWSNNTCAAGLQRLRSPRGGSSQKKLRR